jgi:hypothetical protein
VWKEYERINRTEIRTVPPATFLRRMEARERNGRKEAKRINKRRNKGRPKEKKDGK